MSDLYAAKNIPWYAGILACVIAIPIIVATQLSTDASPAAAICTREQRQGVPCETGPKYQSQVIVLTDPTGAQTAYLVVSDGSKVLATIPLQ